jgi:uncharacterized protein YggE
MPMRSFLPSAALTAALLALPASGQAAQAAPLPTIEVLGTARVMVKPDLAVLSFAVETSAKSAQEAVRQGAEHSQRLLAALKAMAASTDTLQTSAYGVYPVYGKDTRLAPEGYRVRNAVTLETRQVDRLGQFIDEAVKAGATSIAGPSFRTSREDEAKREANAQAVRQAIENGRALAKAAGVTIKRILTIRYSDRGSPRPFPMEAGLAAAAAPTPVVAGDIPVEAVVSVTFELD